MPLTPPTHHPSAQMLANFLIGDCSPGAALLVARHIEACAQCAARIQAMGAVGGAAGEVFYETPRLLRPGVEMARVIGASGIGEAVLSVSAAPAELLPLDEPLAAAEILVLSGGFTADGETYTPGDFLSLEERPVRQAISNPDLGCAYLVTCQDEDDLLSQ